MVAAGAVVAPGTVVKSGEIWGGELLPCQRMLLAAGEACMGPAVRQAGRHVGLWRRL